MIADIFFNGTITAFILIGSGTVTLHFWYKIKRLLVRKN